MQAAADPLLGTLIDGRYRVDRPIASGGFGAVYLAFHVGLGSPVALKVLKLPAALRADQLASLCGAFFDEARTLKRLRHPSIVAALDVGLLPASADGVQLPYLVMEWCSGPTLAAHLGARRGKPMPLGEAFRLFDPLLDAIAHAHAEGVAHRDIKPQNVILALGETAGAVRPRVVDFGIAKLVAPGEAAGSGQTKTVSGSSPFTPRYASPEQLAGGRTGPWTDVHALALVFVEMLIGAPAVGNDENAMFALFDPKRPTPRLFGMDVGALEPVLQRALALQPRDRYPDASAFAQAMRAAMSLSGAPIESYPAVRIEPIAPIEPRATTTGEGTAPPASHTLRTTSGQMLSNPPALPSKGRGAAFFALAAFAVLVVALAATAGVARYTGSYPFRPRLRDVPLAEIDKRASRLGLGTCFPNQSADFHTLACEKGLLLVMHVGLPQAALDAIKAQVNSTALMYSKTYGAGEYAIDGNFAVILGAKPELMANAMSTLLGEDKVDFRGKAEDYQTPPARSASANEALASWTGKDLWSSVAATGEHISYVDTTTNPAQVITDANGKTVTVALYALHGKEVLASFKERLKEPFAYALDGEKLLVVSGDPSGATVEHVQKLLRGARAGEVRRSGP